MSPIVRNILAVVAGIVVGSAVNMGLVTVIPALIPLPHGVDMNSAESIARAMPLLEPKHFLAPFLSHALGTLAGALSTYLIAATRKRTLPYIIALLFLVGGIAAATMIPAPAWFVVLDLVVAYLPMGWLAIRIGEGMQKGNGAVSPA